jgi:phage-related protein
VGFEGAAAWEWLKQWRVETPTTTDIKNLYEALTKFIHQETINIMATMEQALKAVTGEVAALKESVGDVAREAGQVVNRIDALILLLEEGKGAPDKIMAVAAALKEQNDALKSSVEKLDSVSGVADVVLPPAAGVKLEFKAT